MYIFWTVSIRIEHRDPCRMLCCTLSWCWF